MGTNKLSLSTMPDVCFSGWLRVIYFMRRQKPVLPFFLPFSFVFIVLDFFVILDS